MRVNTLRAVNDTDPRPINDLGGAIAGTLKVNGRVDVTAVGAEAVYNALRSIIKAEEMLRRDEGWEGLYIDTHLEMVSDKHKAGFKFIRFRCVADRKGGGLKYETSKR